MKLQLKESGLQNIRSLAKNYSKAIIYFHKDLDGVTSALAAKYYLKQYGIETIDCQQIQYGADEWAIQKPQNGILPVLVDFAHGKPFMKIHTDHHSSQIAYQGSAQQFRHSRSNAETLSSVISTYDIFSQEDIRIINMVDSAGYRDENVSTDEMLQIMLKVDKSKNAWRNHIQMGMVVGKLLLTFKNKPNYLERIVMESKPSLISMYLTMIKIIKEHVDAGEKGWFGLEQIQKNSDSYRKQQEGNKLRKGDISSLEDMKSGQSMMINKCIVQVGGGYMSKSGMYDRYTAFRLYPESKYFLMLWDSFGMIQLSKNPWDKEQSDIHLGELVINGVIDRFNVKSILNSDKNRISLLAIKLANEDKVTIDNENDVIGYKFDDFAREYPKPLKHMSEKQQFLIKKYMDWTPSQFINGDEKDVKRAIDMLSRFYVPLYDIIKLQSGGHPAITNITGFGYLNTQQKVSKMVDEGKNPYVGDGYKKDKDDESITKCEKLMKYVAKEILYELFKATKKKDNPKKEPKTESLSNKRLANRSLLKYVKNFDNNVLESLNEALYDDFYESLKEYYDNYEYKRQRYSKMDLVKGLCESLKNANIDDKLKTLIKNVLI